MIEKESKFGIQVLEKVEAHQVSIYIIFLMLAVIFGLLNTEAVYLDIFISPLLGVLMYGMFVQIPFLKSNGSATNMRFVVALLLGNFVAVPLIV